jgi:ribosomal-protein-alanine N-acetyltransferase
MRGADVDPYVQAFLADPPMLETLGVDDGPSEREVRALLKRSAQQRQDGQRLQLAIADPGSDEFAGEIVLHRFDWHHRRSEIGFFTRREYRRRGMTLEAVRLLTDYAFEALGIHRMALVTNPSNHSTQRLAERAGFQRDGVLRDYTFERGRFVDNVVFSRLAGE